MNKIVAKKIIFNIIISLLFIIDLILVLILFNFETTANLEIFKFILVVLEIILALVLVSLDYIFKIKKWINTIVHNVIIEIQKFVSNKFEKWAIQLKVKLNTENEEYHHLAPTFLEKSKYVSILKSQIDNPHIKNMAISGPYSSGKSSIIHTFQLSYPQYKCLNLSLAAFALKEFTIEKDTQVSTECMRMEELEYSLVQQFFYHVKAKDIPDSRFGRIRRWNWFNKTIATTSVLLFILCSLYLIKPNWLETIIKDQEFFNNSYLQYTCIAISGIILFYATYKFVSYIHKFNGGRVKLMNYEIELQKDIKTSIFNRYLDELVYLFQTTKYEIVILEDLDRFDNTNIFARLRELNTLLNQSQDIGRRIVFIYALSDSVFEKSIERTKFFDFILPIIPHTNSSNSADQFVKILGMLVKREDDSKDDIKDDIKGITTNFINDIAPFISDLRTIKAIVTEYKISSPLLDEKLSQQNLLAMIIYKNLCPKDFDKIYEGEGRIVDAFRHKSELIDKRMSSINEEIRKINEEIVKIKNEELMSIDELKSVVVSSLIKQIPSSSYLCDINKNKVAYNELFEDQSIDNILNKNYKYMYYSTRYNSYVNVSSNLEDKFDYGSRKENIISKYKFKEYELEKTKKELENQSIKLSGTSMKDLCCLDNTIIPIDEGTSETMLLNFLIKRGYIDEQYYYYITIITDGILTKNDKDYVLSIKCNGDFNENDINHKLDNPKIVLKYLIPQDFQCSKIFNVSIVNEILNQNEKIYKTHLVRKIKEGGCDVIKFLRKYLTTDSINGQLIQLFVENYKNLWGEIEDDLSITIGEKIIIFNNLLKYATSLTIYLNSYDDKRFKLFIEENPYIQYIKSPDTKDKFKEIIKHLKVKIKEISMDSSFIEFTDFLYHGNFYTLNKNNVRVILQLYSDINISLHEGAIYSAVLDANIEPLTSYINANIGNFVKECVLSSSNTEESESTIVLLLNNDEISLEFKKDIIEHNETIIENVEDIKIIDLRNKLYSINKVKPSLLNIAIYLLYNNIDEIDSTLLKFINSNSDSIINCIKNSEENDIAIEALLKKDGVIDEIWQEIFKNPFYDESIKNSGIALSREQMLFYINTEEKADEFLMSFNLEFIDLLNKSLTLSKNTEIKMDVVASYLEKNPELEISSIYSLLIAMGDKFIELTSNKGKLFEIEKSPEAEYFIEQLLRHKIVSKKKEIKTKIKVFINK